jgi:hypothetical protein
MTLRAQIWILTKKSNKDSQENHKEKRRRKGTGEDTQGLRMILELEKSVSPARGQTSQS